MLTFNPSFLCIQSDTVRITLFALDSLFTAMTQSSAYLVNRSPLVSSSLSSSFSMMFDNNGDKFPPCGVPSLVSLYPCGVMIYVYGLRLPLGLHCLWPAYPPCTPYIRFLSVRLRFRYPFFSPTPHDVNLGSRYGVRWQLRPLGTFTTD